MELYALQKARLAGLLFACALLLAACGSGDPPDAGGTAGPAVLSGAVTYRERMPLRLDAVIKVRLEDVSLADAPAMILAEQEIPARGLSVPVPFRLEYDPARIDERYRYAVRAEIRGAGNELLWTTTTSHPVLTRGAPRDGVEVVVERVARRGGAVD